MSNADLPIFAWSLYSVTLFFVYRQAFYQNLAEKNEKPSFVGIDFFIFLHTNVLRNNRVLALIFWGLLVAGLVIKAFS